MPIPQDSGELTRDSFLTGLLPWQGWGRAGEEDARGRDALQFYCRRNWLQMEARQVFLPCWCQTQRTWNATATLSQNPQAPGGSPAKGLVGSRCRIGPGAVCYSRRDYFKNAMTFRMDCGFGEGAVAGVWRRRDRKEERCFPTRLQRWHPSWTFSVSVSRGQLCPGREDYFWILCCIPESPSTLKSMIHKYVAFLRSTAPLGLTSGQPEVEKLGSCGPRRDADWELCGHCRQGGVNYCP